jgi:hypothetical protein
VQISIKEENAERVFHKECSHQPIAQSGQSGHILLISSFQPVLWCSLYCGQEGAEEQEKEQKINTEHRISLVKRTYIVGCVKEIRFGLRSSGHNEAKNTILFSFKNLKNNVRYNMHQDFNIFL